MLNEFDKTEITKIIGKVNYRLEYFIRCTVILTRLQKGSLKIREDNHVTIKKNRLFMSPFRTVVICKYRRLKT